MVAWKILVSVQPRAASPVTGSRQSGAVAGYSDLAPRLRRLSVGGRLRGCGCRKPWRAASTTRTRLTATHAAKAQHNVDHGPVLTGKGAGEGHPARGHGRAQRPTAPIMDVYRSSVTHPGRT